MAVIGLDIGTTGVKSTVVDYDGMILGYAYREYDLICDQPGHYEVDLEIIEAAVFEVLQESARPCEKEIKAICATSFGESVVLLDEKERVLCTSMIYMDTRGKQETDEFESVLGRQNIIANTGLAPSEMYTAGKLRWIAKNRADVFSQVKRIHFIADFILSRLGGAFYTDYSLASRSMLFDVVSQKWWGKAMDEAGLDAAMFPEPVATGSRVGLLNAASAERTGISAGIPLMIGGHDQVANAVGAGLLEAGKAMNGIGTVDCITAAFSPEKGQKILENDIYAFVPYIDGRNYVTYAVSFSGGSIIKWFRNTFAKDLPVESAYDVLNSEAPIEPTRLMVIPHLAGRGTPFINVNAKACFDNIDLSVDRGTLFRALMEAETMEMRLNIDYLADCGVCFDSIRTVGGGAKSELWMQIRADVFRKEIISMDTEQAGALGCAMFALVYLGVYQNLSEARNAILKERKRFYPNEKNAVIYDEKYAEYVRVYNERKERKS